MYEEREGRTGINGKLSQQSTTWTGVGCRRNSYTWYVKGELRTGKRHMFTNIKSFRPIKKNR